MKNILSILLVSSLTMCNSLQKSESPIIDCNVGSLVGKIAKISFEDVRTRKELNGKFVEMDGIFRNNFEDLAIYSSESAKYSTAIWLNFVDQVGLDSLLHSLGDKRVRIIGRLNLSMKGHLNGYQATLDSAFCIRQLK